MQQSYIVRQVTLSKSDLLTQQVVEAYDQLFQDQLASEYPFIVNCRNYIPRILELENGEQRYLTFNRIRRELIANNNITEFPTACGVGTSSDKFTLTYTRARFPITFFSNPTQTETVDYPSVYGTPRFSRAACFESDLFVSGTASIKGSETLFINDIVKQTNTSLDNIEILISVYPREYILKYTIYVKNKNDNDIVTSLLLKRNITNYQILNNDLCRDNLLVEIEAHPIHLKDYYVT